LREKLYFWVYWVGMWSLVEYLGNIYAKLRFGRKSEAKLGIFLNSKSFPKFKKKTQKIVQQR